MVRDSVDRVLETRRDLDFVVFPIVASWRHYVELRLKLIWLELANLRDERSKVYKTHDLAWLWSRVRPLLLGEFPAEPEALLAPVDEHVRDLHAIDPDGMRMRYTVDLEGRPSLPPTFTCVSYIGLRDTVEDVSQTLEGIACHVKSAVDFVAGRRMDLEE